MGKKTDEGDHVGPHLVKKDLTSIRENRAGWFGALGPFSSVNSSGWRKNAIFWKGMLHLLY